MLHHSFQPYLPQVITILKNHKIKNAYVFGSVVTDKFNEKSDVDFLLNIELGLDPVEAGGHLWDIYYELKDLLNREVDILTERTLKNPYFIKEINRTKYPIYGY
jgi:predicted nucleotidyltransferase